MKISKKIELNYNIQNTDRAIGTRFASEVTTKLGMNILDEDQVTVNLNGSAGQSLGAFSVKGTTLKVSGDANDYVGKGLSGGKIIIKPKQSSKLKTNENVIIGNTVLYGATSGTLSWDTVGVAPGTYYYQCGNHLAMYGKIEVLAEPGPVAAAGSFISDTCFNINLKL